MVKYRVDYEREKTVRLAISKIYRKAIREQKGIIFGKFTELTGYNRPLQS